MYEHGHRQSGVYTIQPLSANISFQVYCNLTDGGWTYLQHRFDGRLMFNRTMQEYIDGFGDLRSEFWLGLKYMHILTAQRRRVKIEVLTDQGQWRNAMFSHFSVGGASSTYTLAVSGFQHNSHNLCEDILKYNNGHAFTSSCSDRYFGWWFDSCTYNSINGAYNIKGNELGFTEHACHNGVYNLVASVMAVQWNNCINFHNKLHDTWNLRVHGETPWNSVNKLYIWFSTKQTSGLKILWHTNIILIYSISILFRLRMMTGFLINRTIFFKCSQLYSIDRYKW